MYASFYHVPRSSGRRFSFIFLFALLIPSISLVDTAVDTGLIMRVNVITTKNKDPNNARVRLLEYTPCYIAHP